MNLMQVKPRGLNRLLWTGPELRKLRTDYGETQVQFAARLRVSRDGLRSWESGRINIPPVVQLFLDRLREDIDKGKPRPSDPGLPKPKK